MSLDAPEGVVTESTKRRITRRRRVQNREPDSVCGVTVGVSFSEQVRAELRVLHGQSLSSPADARRRRRAINIRNMRVGMYDPTTGRRVLSREQRMVIEETGQKTTNAALQEAQQETRTQI